MKTIRPMRGHAFLLPEGEDIWASRETNLIRHPDHVPISQIARVMAIGAPEVRVVQREGAWKRIEAIPMCRWGIASCFQSGAPATIWAMRSGSTE